MAKDGDTRQRILAVTIAAIERNGSRNVRIAEIATRSGVGVPTIYYHFESRTQLIAEAQVAIYQSLSEPLRGFLPRAETALAANDRAAFYEAIGSNAETAWALGQTDEKWGVLKLLLDVWSQPKVRDEFCSHLDVQFERWNDAMDHAKELGWISAEADTRTLVATFWAASIGQVITSQSPQFNPGPDEARRFFMNAAGVPLSDPTSA